MPRRSSALSYRTKTLPASPPRKRGPRVTGISLAWVPAFAETTILHGCRLLLPVLILLAQPALSAADPVDRLVATEPDLAAIAAAVGKAADKAKDQQQWLAGRGASCPAAVPGVKGRARDIAVDCLERLYEQRLSLLEMARNAAAWPHVRFRPALVEGGGDRMCEELHHDLDASFFGRGLDLDPLGEREIGFAPIAGLADDSTVALRADFDPYNNGKPFPIVEWRTDADNDKPATVQYVGYASEGALLAAIGRGVQPLTMSVRAAGQPVIDLPAPAAGKPRTRPLAFFAGHAVLPVDEAGRFFRYDGKVYLLSPLQPVAGAPGDLGVYRLAAAEQVHRLCLFDARLPLAGLPPDPAVSPPEVAAMQRAVAPLLPTGKLCAAEGEGPSTLAARAAWRPWTLGHPFLAESGLGDAQLALFLSNRALTGPEQQRQYRNYVAARAAAIGALAPFFAAQFGRSPAEAKRFAALYLDRGVADRFVFDPDDDAVAALFAADYAQKHKLQQAALAGDTAALRAQLRLEPAALAAGATHALDEPLLSDAVAHPDTLQALLDMGLDPNIAGSSGRTPLMVAARLDLVDAARLLLARGADPNTGAGDAVAQSDLTGDVQCMQGAAAASDTPGRTALSYAVERASPALVKLLLDHQAKKDQRDSAGRRPADYLAARGGDPAVKAAIAALLK
jgi:uncharacterized protein